MEGFEIANIISSYEKPITTIVVSAHSIATVIALAAPLERRKIVENNSYMIHNPMLSQASGSARELEMAAMVLRDYEDFLADFYADHTSARIPQIRGWMNEEKFISTQDLLAFGFVSEVVVLDDPLFPSIADAQPAQIAAFLPPSSEELKKLVLNYNLVFNHNKAKHIMSNNTEVVKELKGLRALIQNFFTKEPEPQASEVVLYDVALKDGTTLAVATSNQFPSVGDMVKIENKAAADGEYETKETGKIIVIQGGVITAINEQPEPEETVEVVALLKDFMQGFQGFQTQNETQIQALQRQVESYQGEVESYQSQIGSYQEANQALLQRIESLEGKLTQQAETHTAELTALKEGMVSSYTPPTDKGETPPSKPAVGKQSHLKQMIKDAQSKK